MKGISWADIQDEEDELKEKSQKEGATSQNAPVIKILTAQDNPLLKSQLTNRSKPRASLPPSIAKTPKLTEYVAPPPPSFRLPPETELERSVQSTVVSNTGLNSDIQELVSPPPPFQLPPETKQKAPTIFTTEELLSSLFTRAKEAVKNETPEQKRAALGAISITEIESQLLRSSTAQQVAATPAPVIEVEEEKEDVPSPAIAKKETPQVSQIQPVMQTEMLLADGEEEKTYEPAPHSANQEEKNELTQNEKEDIASLQSFIKSLQSINDDVKKHFETVYKTSKDEEDENFACYDGLFCNILPKIENLLGVFSSDYSTPQYRYFYREIQEAKTTVENTIKLAVREVIYIFNNIDPEFFTVSPQNKNAIATRFVNEKEVKAIVAKLKATQINKNNATINEVSEYLQNMTQYFSLLIHFLNNKAEIDKKNPVKLATFGRLKQKISDTLEHCRQLKEQISDLKSLKQKLELLPDPQVVTQLLEEERSKEIKKAAKQQAREAKRQIKLAQFYEHEQKKQSASAQTSASGSKEPAKPDFVSIFIKNQKIITDKEGLDAAIGTIAKIEGRVNLTPSQKNDLATCLVFSVGKIKLSDIDELEPLIATVKRLCTHEGDISYKDRIAASIIMADLYSICSKVLNNKYMLERDTTDKEPESDKKKYNPVFYHKIAKNFGFLKMKPHYTPDLISERFHLISKYASFINELSAHMAEVNSLPVVESTETELAAINMSIEEYQSRIHEFNAVITKYNRENSQLDSIQDRYNYAKENGLLPKHKKGETPKETTAAHKRFVQIGENETTQRIDIKKIVQEYSRILKSMAQKFNAKYSETLPPAIEEAQQQDFNPKYDRGHREVPQNWKPLSWNKEVKETKWQDMIEGNSKREKKPQEALYIPRQRAISI